MQKVCKSMSWIRGLKVNNGLLVQITMVTKAKQGDCSMEPRQCETTAGCSGGQTTRLSVWGESWGESYIVDAYHMTVNSCIPCTACSSARSYILHICQLRVGSEVTTCPACDFQQGHHIPQEGPLPYYCIPVRWISMVIHSRVNM